MEDYLMLLYLTLTFSFEVYIQKLDKSFILSNIR